MSEVARLDGDVHRSDGALQPEFHERFANPVQGRRLGYIDEIIRPRDTRWTIVRSLRTLANKRQSNLPRKHGNIPL